MAKTMMPNKRAGSFGTGQPGNTPNGKKHEGYDLRANKSKNEGKYTSK